MAQLGDILSELREDRNLTQKELSQILHISNSSISSYETGVRAPNIETLVQLAKYFEVTTDYLIGLTSNNISPSELSEEYVNGATIGVVINSLKRLPPVYRSAIMLVLNSMQFYVDIAEKTEGVHKD